MRNKLKGKENKVKDKFKKEKIQAIQAIQGIQKKQEIDEIDEIDVIQKNIEREEKMQKLESNNGVSFIGILTTIFIALKVAHVINWSWIWVLSPLWISFFINCLIFITVVFIILIYISKRDKED